MKHLGPLVKERSEQEARYGKDWAERPVGTLILSWRLLLLFHIQNDVLSWLVEISKGRELPLEEITLFILFVNFVAIHTTTMARKLIFTDKDFSHSPLDRYAFAI